MSVKRSVASAGPVRDLVCPWVHTEVSCDGCRASRIFGYRYKCQERQDFDLCSKCLRETSPEAHRNFVRIGRCQASKPYQIYYIECHDCGSAPIKGPRYQHKTKAKVDLCEGCFKRATSSQYALESDFERIEETKTRSFRNKHHPALHFDKACDECGSCPIFGPCFTLVKKPDYDVCAYCHDYLIMQNKFEEGDFVVAANPGPSATFHLKIISCVSCGVFPICGPSYQHQRKENKNLCLLCYFHVKKEKKGYYTRVEPPHAISIVVQASPPNVAPKPSPVPNHSASHSTHHMPGSSFAPAHRPTSPQDYGPKSASFHQPSSATGPYPYSRSLHPSNSVHNYPGSYPGHGPYAANYFQPYGPASGAQQTYIAPTNAHNQNALTQQQQMHTLCNYYAMQSAQRQEQILAAMQQQQHAPQETQSQFLQHLVHLITGGSGGGGGVDFSCVLVNNSDGGVDYSSFLGGNAGSGLDFSSVVGGGGAVASVLGGGVIGNLVGAFSGLSFD